MIHRGYKYKLAPTDSQTEKFVEFAGVCRFVYNLALEQRRDHYRNFKINTGNNINYFSQSHELTLLRKECDWISSVSSTCEHQALRDLDEAFNSFFKGIAKYPGFRKQGVNDTFRFQGREVSIKKLNSKWSMVRLPKIGWVKFRDTRSVVGKINNVTIKSASDGWYVIFNLSIEHEVVTNDLPSVGIDRGVTQTLALSTGEFLNLPVSLKVIEKNKRKAQKILSRRKKGSKRYAKAKQVVSKLYTSMTRIRKDWHHRTTLDLSQRFGTVVLEDLNTKGMTARAHGSNVRQKAGLNRSILNQGWHIFETLLNYKVEQNGGFVFKVPAHYTSQTCFECGIVDKASRESQASFRCRYCGHHANADTNAAKNILRRNTPFMVVEEGQWPSCEAIIRRGNNVSENQVVKSLAA